ncbi:MgtC/SapB family protein [Roseateles koreensis]|uniref:Protein MgtC n=1 Tax=Roseateles koreensis TaxID=2987526 RepID=A0ABT5KW67_9BURK|nr:MgtC/SapB family protein [Roseateles koreensis]MDC8787181.1 MgtC/SapB family protein [Roseateles koreensis]
MNLLDVDHLLRYWSQVQFQINVLMLLHLLGAGCLGLILGYERAFHGRAAGMRTYALVCMASTGVIVVLAFPEHWFGGHQAGGLAPLAVDPTRVVQGILTGIGFLCAGVIMREGMNISGLTTAASIWAASSIGVMVGMGFYLAAIALTLLCAGLMMWGAKLEARLPSHPAISVFLRGEPGRHFTQTELTQFSHQLGYMFAPGSMSVAGIGDREEWQFVCTSFQNYGSQTLTRYASRLREISGVTEYRVTHARN